MKKVIITLLVMFAVCLANDLKEKRKLFSNVQQSYLTDQRFIQALQDSIAKYEDMQKIRTGYLMCLQDDIRKMVADSVAADTTKKVKKNAK